MKTTTRTLIILVCLLSANLSIATTPEKKAIEKEKAELINKISKTISSLSFIDCVKCGEHEQVVLRCVVNDNEEVVVKSILGVNVKLKQAILRRIEKKAIKASPVLCGQKLAFRFKFEKHQKQ
ncbi:hypothetical protein L3073_11765 [Ancylomarina sp. DW003]|nr:hypothetical protein [Ancylomarina sp. DW003]MDE5422887.1 hypothetical protein [Ancylomarina sp. DW003]